MLCAFVILVGVVLWEAHQLNTTKEELAYTKLALQASERDARFYRAAYDIALHDIASLSKIYGGEQRFAEKAAQLKREDVFRQLPHLDVVIVSHTQRTTNETCVPEVVLRETPYPVVVRAFGNGPLSLYMNGLPVREWTIHDETIVGVNLSVTETSEVALVALDGNITIIDLFIGPYRVQQSTLDFADPFDCMHVTEGLDITEPGALRIRLALAEETIVISDDIVVDFPGTWTEPPNTFILFWDNDKIPNEALYEFYVSQALQNRLATLLAEL